MEVFHLQAGQNPVYRAFLHYLGVNPTNITQIHQVPFMPVEFFKQHRIATGNWEEKEVFTSSGTTGMRVSQHFIEDPGFYLRHSLQIFESFYGAVTDYHILALLPGYLEREGSSLIAMVQYFIERSEDSHGGFFLHNHDELRERITWLSQNSDRKILLLGVSFALLDFAEEGDIPELNNLIVMETGGMKGRRKEILREELHETLCKAFHVTEIHSEYGMTECLSQSYSKGGGIFRMPFSMRIYLRDANDPLDSSNEVSRGAINIIDLANVHSCSFLQVGDLAEKTANGFRVLGRMDNSDVRGCNLMVQSSF
ncbi:acyl transferase [Fulvivirga sedimenti]|uniref:Acyl transferase n=1 Tax=Fulvivirga sedimenti TaxID=2879465 RepID=A0A9X1HS38_9BACT|nr:acyl transferase [Fulvivirga sedimenti]MCA6075202.1 acyl transferase [Fulvivirga sedimenti]MCA6076379.1 acyl transferase [Fulvivirga sedimenti]MCA6077507.1 acyl transferase [Fulvivirga sedimenti]